MQNLSDGDLLYMIHFDRTNFTPKWIQKAEREAQRRRLTLHLINDNYRATSAAKTIKSEIDLEYAEPRSWQKKLYPWMLAFTVYSIFRASVEREFTTSLVVVTLGLIGFCFYLWRNSKGRYLQVNNDRTTKNHSMKL